MHRVAHRSVRHSWRWNTRVLAMALIIALTVPMVGCVLGNYRGSRLEHSAKKVVVFEIAGERGQECTALLVTNLCAPGRAAVLGSKLVPSTPPTSITEMANLARQAGAEAFVTGTITKAMVQNYSQFVVRGNFELYDAEKGHQIGGLSDAECVEDAEPGFWFRFSPVPANNGPYEEFIRQCGIKAQALAPQAIANLAKHVAQELDNGLK